MNIKSLLLGSAAALAVVSGAQAADAIVAAEPEPMEYVRVCDAFGTGYFYIPGTETCLKIGGEVRATVYANESGVNDDDLDEDYNSEVRARITFDGVPADPMAAKVLLDVMNPVVDLDDDLGLYGAVNVETIRAENGLMIASGRTQIPEKPAENTGI